MKERKGFTLIELLAVIVVLGIIMLIAVTAVSNVINNSKTNSFKTSAMMVAKQIRNEVLPMGYTNNQTIDCLNGNYGLNPNNYDYCNANISIINDVTKIYVDLVGKGNFNGLAIVGATMDSASTTNNTTYQSLKTVLITAAGTNDISVNKYNGNGLYKWGTKYIYRGGITKTNSGGINNDTYTTDVDSGTNPNNYVKVPWETYSGGETCINETTNKCWRVISINTDGSITIIRDVNAFNQVFDNTYNNDAADNFGYNDLLSNAYRGNSMMFDRLYGTSGYQSTTLKNYYSLLNTVDVCLNKINNHVGVNDTNYTTAPYVTDTCNVAGKSDTIVVNSLKNQYVRLPYIEEYLNASLQNTCTFNYQYQCRNQNFMYNNGYYWSLNGHPTFSWTILLVNVNGSVVNYYASDSRGVRPVVNLKSTILISGGTGTAGDPYVIKS